MGSRQSQGLQVRLCMGFELINSYTGSLQASSSPKGEGFPPFPIEILMLTSYWLPSIDARPSDIPKLSSIIFNARSGCINDISPAAAIT